MNDEQFDQLKDLMGGKNPKPFSEAANNPLIWVSFVGALIVVLGSLVLFIYNFQQTALEEKVEKIEVNFKTSQTAQSKILEDQRVQSQSLKVLTQVITDLSATVSDMRSDRFRAQDFPVHMEPYKQIIEKMGKKIEAQEGIIYDVKEIKSGFSEMRSSFADIKTRLLRMEIKSENGHQ